MIPQSKKSLKVIEYKCIHVADAQNKFKQICAFHF